MSHSNSDYDISPSLDDESVVALSSSVLSQSKIHFPILPLGIDVMDSDILNLCWFLFYFLVCKSLNMCII